MTLATLPDLSKITSLMSPIFSFASLYTSTPASLDPRHSPSLCVVALVVESTWFVAVCADAAPVIDAVARNAIARHLESMMFLHCFGNNHAVGLWFQRRNSKSLPRGKVSEKRLTPAPKHCASHSITSSVRKQREFRPSLYPWRQMISRFARC